MKGILRTLDPETRKAMQKRMEDAVVKTGEAYGVKAVLEVEHSYCPLINDYTVTRIVEKTSKETLGEENVIAKKNPTLKVEDFAYFADELPCCFYEIGCRNEALGCNEPLHNGRFKVDEDCISIGTELQVRNTLALLNK
jgi:metal-dependent amidase/aminoacylase/carboxypeptidase family protein